MSEIEQKKTLISIDQLRGWDKNPRMIDPDEKPRLKNQLKTLGQYKPLIVTMEGDIGVVLGGNMRLPVLRELRDEGDERFANVWISIVDAPDDKAKLQYALSDNDRAGRYDERALGTLMNGIDPIVMQDYRIDVGYSTSLEALAKRYEITTGLEERRGKSPEKELDVQKLAHKCPNCEYEFDD